ncbi:beta-propeller fold lactonase family protein [Streptomyces sp. NPDC059637]|uniref:YncE family protein n=1 Tax=Streptomyces sp. NPDC059637 TaxID=3347752 RepID=UPI0036786345
MTAGQKNTPARTRRTCALALAAAVLAGAAAVSPAAAADRAAPEAGAAAQQRPGAAFAVTSAEVTRGLYQSAYSARNDVLWATASVGRPPVTRSRLLKLDPDTLEVEASFTPPVLDPATGAVEAVYGVAVDDEHDTVWTTNTRNDSVAVYSQRTGRHLATLEDVAHAREVVVDERRDLAWASSYEDGSVVAFDTRTLKEVDRITLEGSGPMGLDLDARTGTVYAADLKGDRVLAFSRGSDEVRAIPVAGEGAIGIDLTRNGRTAYVAEQTSGTVSVVDLRTGGVTRSVATGAGALSVSDDGRTGLLYVANRDSGTTTVVDPRKGTVLADLATGARSNHVTVARGAAYVLDKSASGADSADSAHRITGRR